MTLTPRTIRLDLKCGRGAISQGEKCHKGAATSAAQQPANSSNTIKRVAVGAAITGLATLAILKRKQWTQAAENAWRSAKPFNPQKPPKGAEYLGQGNNGTIWIAKDRKSIFKIPKHKKSLLRLDEEVAFQVKLKESGVNVPEIYHYDRKNGVVQMQFMDGYTPLARALKSPDAELKGEYARKFTAQLAKMHRLGHSHGDLNYNNVLIKNGDLSLIDFGFASTVEKKGLLDIGNLIHMTRELDPEFSKVLKEEYVPLQTIISSAKRPTKKDLDLFYKRVADRTQMRFDSSDQVRLTPRTIRLDLKCGRGAISQGEKCHKGPATKKKENSVLTAGNIAKAAAVVAAPFAVQAAARSKAGKYVGAIFRTTIASIGKKPLPKGKKAADWLDLPNGPHVTEGNRMRRYEKNVNMRGISHEEFASKLTEVAGPMNSEAKAVSDLIRKHKISVDSKLLDDMIDSPSPKIPVMTRLELMEFRDQLKKNPQAEGFFLNPSMLDGAPPNKVYINYRRNSDTEWKPTRQGVASSMVKFRVARESSVKTAQDLARDPSPENMRAYADCFSTYNTAQADDRDLILGLHEIGHSLDLGIGKRARPLSVRDPATNVNHSVFDDRFKQQARKVTSHYGLSDLEGDRNEFLSETFVLYTLEPAYLRSEAPLVYHWMDTYIAQLRQK